MKKTSTVQLVRNATLKIRYAGHTMLIDPVLADKGTLISALGVNKTPRVHLTIPIQDIIGGVDMVLLTHNHIDHYEPSVPTHLPKEIPFYVQPQDADAIRNDGFTSFANAVAMPYPIPRAPPVIIIVLLENRPMIFSPFYLLRNSIARFLIKNL